jgi:hypothetical protein
MALFDENLYNMDTATYNTSLYFSKMKKEEQELIRSGSTVINEIDGLKNVFKRVFDVGRGFLNRSTITSIKRNRLCRVQLDAATTGRGDDFSIIDVIATKFKDIIWNYDAPGRTWRLGLSRKEWTQD